ncbi:zinc finger protein [Saccharopolyspora sp. ASAGF58]|uniref:zinc finger protein n=1 Tax=Saccharopolyspora sp. ASAGF58 TaxID=2719023 RepID=UPI0014400D04|nr:zinc finger protein [Saccharopolyspora sp. ASAGF58]QIZ35436.1 hypothetical protein FDZ84_12920 [Saccharopolyspora sp. ASAGF58]
MTTYRPRPYSWVPADGLRHASTDARPLGGYATGVVVETLCGHQLRADNTDIGWLWETCAGCNAKAHELAGVPIPPVVDAR